MRVVRWRWPVLIACLLAAGVAAASVRYQDFTADYRVFFGPENPQLAANEATEDIYTKTDTILFVLQPKDKNVFTRENLDIVAEHKERTHFDLRVWASRRQRG